MLGRSTLLGAGMKLGGSGVLGVGRENARTRGYA
jgi:hypothetical protein